MSERRMSTGVSLLAAMIPVLFAANSAVAQVGTVATTPTLNATSPLGAAPGASVEPTGIPLGSTELTSPGLSPAPTGVTGTIAIPSTSSGSACSTVGTAPSSMFGSTASFDGGGMGVGIGSGAPATATTAGSAAMTGTGSSTSPGISSILGTSGVSATPGTLETAGMSGMCGSGSNSVIASSTPTATTPTAPGGVARTGIPLGSFEIGNLGVSATPAVPTPTVSPIVGFVGPTPLAPTVPTIAPPPATTSTAPTGTIGSTRILPTTITPGGF